MRKHSGVELPLPAALDAERLILGSLLVSRISPGEVPLTPDDFSIEKHRQIFTTAGEVHARGEAVNRLTVADDLQRRGRLEACDGLAYLVDLEDESVQVNLDSYVRLVHNKSILRRAAVAGQSLMDECLRAHDAPAELLARAQRMLQDLSDGARPAGSLRSLGEFVEGYPDGLNGLLQPERSTPLVTTPWPSVNRLVTGFRPGQLIIVAGRPSVGKTAFAGQVAERAACAGSGAAFFSLETSTEEIFLRLACSRANVDAHQLRRGELSTDERGRLQAAAAALAELPLYVDDATGCNVASIHAGLRRRGAKNSIRLVLVDYLQLMEAPGRRENRTQEVSAITRGLKLIAREFDVPVVALSQLNRSPETEKRRPSLSDLRDSGSIEQDADVVIMLHQPEAKDGAPAQDAEILVRKQRGGPRGKVALRFKPWLVRFEEPAREDES